MSLVNDLFIIGAKYLFILAALIPLIWFFRLPREEKRSVFIFVVIAFPAIYIVSRIGSWLYFDPRPFVVGHFTPLVSHLPDNGFPSDHVLATSAAASVIFPFRKKLSAVIWAIVVLVGISRVYVGVHHVIDIVGAMAISIATSALVYFVFKKVIKGRKAASPVKQ